MMPLDARASRGNVCVKNVAMRDQPASACVQVAQQVGRVGAALRGREVGRGRTVEQRKFA
jgi:hypothetical protein